MEINPEKRRRRSIRLPDYDYAQPGGYFVTICTHERAFLFGVVVDGEMRLGPVGTIVEECWLAIPDHFPSVALDEFTIMPNHIHGILFMSSGGTACRAPTVERFGEPRSGSLPTVMRSFKSAVTSRINQMRSTPGLPVWQRNYYDQVIRDENSLHRIREYIVGNSAKWEEDPENPNNRSKG